MSIQEILASAISSAIIALITYSISIFKEYLLKKGGESAVRTVEIIARNAVEAVEQIVGQNKDKAVDKYSMAFNRVQNELEKHNIYITDDQLKTFIESAVHQMNNTWKGDANDNSK